MLLYLSFSALIGVNLSLTFLIPPNAPLNLNNHSLGAWPPHLPWSTSIGQDSTLVFTEYGRYAPPKIFAHVRTTLADMRRHIEVWGESDFGSENQCILGSPFLDVDIRCHSSDGKISASAVGEALKAIEGFFFTFNDKPREFSAEIRVPLRSTMSIALKWNYVMDRWPRTLPFNMPLRLNRFFTRLEVYVYGKDLELSSRQEVVKSINWGITSQLLQEDEHRAPGQQDFISRDS